MTDKAEKNMMTLVEAQADMRQGYWGGAAGVLVSGIAWIIAGGITWAVTPLAGLYALFLGGMFIYPGGNLIAKAVVRDGGHSEGNPLAMLALESTVLLFIGLFISFTVFQVQPDWFFPIMLMIIGGRYLVFRTLYGTSIFWMLGGTLLALGIVTLIFNEPVALAAIAGGTIEIGFSFAIMRFANA
ncbi:MAG: hypothetical protein AAFR81_01860 [Chloroflexota bacterium]